MACKAVLVACLLALALSAARAEEASECMGLQSKLNTVQEQVAQCQATEAKCKQASEALTGQLQTAKAEVGTLQAQLATAQKEAAEFRAAAQSAAEASTKLHAAEARAATVQNQLTAAQAKAQAHEKELATAKAELAKAQEASAAALAALKTEFEAAWLPHWLEVRSRSALEAVGPTLKDGGKKAQELWAAHAKPSFDRAVTFSKEKAAELNAALDKHGGAWVPKVKGALAAGTAKASAVLQSEQVAKVKAAGAAGVAKAQATFQQVLGELEAGLGATLQKAYPPLARKPYTTYISYAILGFPVVVLTLPLLGRIVSGGAAAGGPSTPAGGRGRPTPAKRGAKKRYA